MPLASGSSLKHIKCQTKKSRRSKRGGEISRWAGLAVTYAGLGRKEEARKGSQSIIQQADSTYFPGVRKVRFGETPRPPSEPRALPEQNPPRLQCLCFRVELGTLVGELGCFFFKPRC